MTTQTLTLSEFLLARYAEDEAASSLRLSDIQDLGSGAGFVPPGTSYNPRVLAEVEAHRRIVKAAARAQAYLDEGENGYADYAIAHTWSMKVLAAVYADHPDYRPEWRV